MLYAGVARTDITPPLGIAHAGWGAQTHQRAGGIDLPLWATALALSDGDETVVIVDVDLHYLHAARIAAGNGSCAIAVNRRFHRPGDGAVIVGRNPDRPVDHQVKLLL